MSQLLQIIQSRKNKINSTSKEYKYYFEHGGLPGICFIQNKKLRELKIKEQLATILERDVRMIFPTTLAPAKIFDLMQYISKNQGSRFSYTDASKSTQITTPTIKKLIYAFEAMFLIRRLKVEDSYQGEVFFLEDQAESNYLSQHSLSDKEQLEQLIYRNLRAQMYYDLGLSFKEFYFETRGGVRIPYAIECNVFRLAIIPIEEEIPNRVEKSAAGSFLKKYNQSRVLFLH